MAVFEVPMSGDYRFRVVYEVIPQTGGVLVAVTSQWCRVAGAGTGSYNGAAPYVIDIGGVGGSAISGAREFSAPAGGAIGWQWIASHQQLFVTGSQTYITATFATDTSAAGSGAINTLTVYLDVASTASFTGGSTFDAGSAVTVNTNRQNAAYTHDITYKIGNLTGSVGTGIGASVAWTPPLSLLNAFPNASQMAGQIIVTTKNGTTTIGSSTTTAFTLRAPAAAKPTVNSVTAADQNTSVASIVGRFVQGLSRAKLTVNASGYQGSTITAAEVTMSGVTVPSNGEIPVTASGNVPVVGKATDSRGRTNTLNTTLSALPYALPNVTAFQVRRCSTAGVIQDDGLFLRVDLAGAIQSLVNGTERNGITITARSRPTGGGVWTPRNTITPAGLTYNTWFLLSGGGIYSATTSYDVEVTLSDKFGAYIATTTVTTASVTLDLNGKFVGVGKIHELGALDVAGDVYANGVLLLPAASNAETQAGTINNKAVTPAGLAARMLIADQGPTSSYASYPMGASTMFAAPQTTGWPVSGRYGTVHTLRSYAAGGGTIQYWTSYQSGPDADRIWFRQWVYLATAWTEWQELAVRGQNGTPWAQAGGRGTSSASGAVTVTLPAGKFTQPPLVNVMPATHANVLVARLASAVTTTSFQVQLFTMPGAAMAAAGFDWTAIQMTTGSATG